MPWEGSRLPDDCLVCPEGMLCAGERQAHPTGRCAAGYHCPARSTKSVNKCPIGSFCASPNGSSSSTPPTCGERSHELLPKKSQRCSNLLFPPPENAVKFKNVALLKKVKTVDSQDFQKFGEPKRVVDGTSTDASGWHASNTLNLATHELIIDLGKYFFVSSIDLYSGGEGKKGVLQQLWRDRIYSVSSMRSIKTYVFLKVPTRPDPEELHF